ncbi:HNH endonuclease, partial [Alphaproteobacteria bacterium]|nr:HNH endonuclease [Alphaproteobacteria bacterium]
VVTDRVNVVSSYDRYVRSPSFALRAPSVISLKNFIVPNRKPAFTRFNVFLRDRFACQYCGDALPSHELTFDHVVPRFRGGRTTWENVVSACAPCNLRKGGRMPSRASMAPKRLPTQPSTQQLQENERGFPPNFLHDSWRDFLYWDTELDPI